jgi:prolipoprotein diacylglyceryltransferase
MCVALFGLLWAFRRRLSRVPLRMTGVYFILNGAERFFIEKIRVNTEYNWGWVQPSQAEIISVGFVLAGLALLLFTRGKQPMAATENAGAGRETDKHVETVA